MSFYLRFDLFDKSISAESNCQIFKDMNISCTHFGRNYLWIGEDGIIYRCDKYFSLATFVAYHFCVSHIYQCKDKDILITSGMDARNTNDVIKLWDLTKWNQQNIPTVLRTFISSTPGDLDFKVVCFNVLNNLNAMVLGLKNGKIDLIYSDVLNSRRSKRQKIYDLSEEITTIAINQIDDLLYIYLTTTKRIVILAFDEQTKDIKLTLDVDEGTCPRNCSALVDNVFVVANHKGIYDVYLDYVGPCRALDGDNISLHLYKHYLILVKLVKPSVLSGTHTSQRTLTSNYQIVIFDHVHRFIAGEFPLPDFNFLFIEWGSIYVYCGPPTNKILIFTEKDIQSKLKIFFQKNSFKLAIEIAKSQNFDEDALADMFRQYGDHLYKEKHYDEAIQQYIKTIGKMEPSFVITNYLTTSQIPNLVKYVEVLVQREYCTGEHIALLLNCYIIIKDYQNLMTFIKNHKVMQFDIDKVFNLLQKDHLFVEALELAKRYEKHDWYLKILIEDQHNYDDAIDYISNLTISETEEALLNYGNTLINVEPEILAKQLERVCDKQKDSKLNITTILNVFVNNRKGLKHFLNRYISKIVSIEDNHSIYVDTLIELLLYEVEKEPQVSKESAAEVMNILQNENLLYHRSKALVCCQMRGFTKGYRYICELQANYLEILNSYREENDIEGIMDTCHRFGGMESALWIKALEYLIEVKADEKYFSEVINEIEEHSLISPLLLLEKMTLSSHSLQFGLVKDFVMRYYDKNEKLINEYQNEISKLKEETKKNNDTIQCLDTEVQVFQNLKCMVCSNTLDIPSIHFLCNHSYHMRCFETYTYSKEECPNCAPKIEEILNEINQWKTDKVTSFNDISSLSLEKLWQNVLTSSHHPITIDPDQFLSDALTQSMISSNGHKERIAHSASDSKVVNVPNVNKNKESSSSLAKENVVTLPTMNVINNEIKNNTLKKVYSAEKFIAQSSDNPFNVVNRKESPKILKLENKPIDIKTLKNPFDDNNIKIPTNINNKNDNYKLKNPFGDFDKSGNDYPDNLNPFE